MSKSEAIIKKTFIAIVDISNMSKNVMWEFNTLLKNKKNIIICEENNVESKNSFLNEFIIIKYSYDKIDELEYKIQSAILNLIKKDKQDFFNEAQRLIDKQEYNAAAIAAFRKLEMALGNKYEYNSTRKLLLSSMVNILVKEKKVDIDLKEVKYIINLRNQLVHEGAEINKKQAIHMVQTIEQLISKIRRKKY